MGLALLPQGCCYHAICAAEALVYVLEEGGVAAISLASRAPCSSCCGPFRCICTAPTAAASTRRPSCSSTVVHVCCLHTARFAPLRCLMLLLLAAARVARCRGTIAGNSQASAGSTTHSPAAAAQGHEGAAGTRASLLLLLLLSRRILLPLFGLACASRPS